MLSLEPIVDAEGVSTWQAVNAAAFSADYVGLTADPAEERLPALRGPVSGERAEFWLGSADGVPVAAGELTLPLYDNLGAAYVEIQIHPEHRRKGYGRALLGKLRQRTREENRTVPYLSSADAGAAFARAAGAQPVLTEVRRMLDVTFMAPAALAELTAGAAQAATGYTMLTWQDRAPEELHAGLAELMARMSTDTPMEDMALDPEDWDVPRYRERQEATLASGRRTLGCAVRHESTGALAGFTEITVNRRRTNVAYQWDTIVLEAHRGHRLGLWLKAANLTQLRALSPQTRLVNTWNAASNPHMIAINEALGFRAAEAWTNWQLDLAPH